MTEPNIELTPIPSPTLEPLPTLPPTPEVTPIPTLSTGFDLPTPEPFWIYGWRGNTVWRMHSERQEEEVLLDTMAVLGVPLADNVPLPHDEFTVGPAVEVSPGGNQLAVVTAAVEPNATREEQVTFLIAIVDLNSGQHTMLDGASRGVQFTIHNSLFTIHNFRTGESKHGNLHGLLPT